MGELRKAEQFLGAAVESAPRSIEDIRCHALVRKGIALWFLGFADQALSLAREGLTLRDDAQNRYTYPVVLFWAAHLHELRGELAPAEDLFQKSLKLATERGFPLIMALNTISLGCSWHCADKQTPVWNKYVGEQSLPPEACFGRSLKSVFSDLYWRGSINWPEEPMRLWPPSYQPLSGGSKVARRASSPRCTG